MKQSSKIIVGLAAVLLVIIAGGAWFLYSNLSSLVARIIVEEGSEATQTQVSVGAVSIDLRDGTAGIGRLAVANPEGFSEQSAIALENFTIELDPMAVTSDPLVIERIAVDGARLLVEQNGAENNLRTILASIERQAADPAAADTEATKVIIERFELTNASATLLVPSLNEERQVGMPEIVLTDVGRATNGATAASLAEQLLAPLIRTALESAAARGIGDALREKVDETRSDVAEDLLDRLGDRDRKDPDENLDQ